MTKLKEVITLFFRLGIVAFGGPAAHIAMVHKEVVDKRKWMDEEHYLDLVGATSLIPGPNSTEMVIHCGYHRAGLKGLFAAGFAFILPACLLTGFLAYLYQIAIKIKGFEVYLMGIKPVVIVLILLALKKLGKKALKNTELKVVASAVFLLGFTSLSEVFILLAGALLGFLLLKKKTFLTHKSIALTPLFWVFFKIGSILFGSGYVLIAYLQAELVDHRAWLTTGELADAIAIGQFTPGPVLSTSTFIGYLLAGTPGAILSSIGIFLPSFFFVWILNPLIPKMRSSKNFSYLLDGLNAAAVGIMAYALYPLGKTSFSNLPTIIIFILTLGLVWKFPKISSIKLVLFGMLAGGVLQTLVHFL